MYFLLSPAKTLDFDSAALSDEFSQPCFLKDSNELISVMADLSKEDVSNLMGVSDKIAALNVERVSQWRLPFSLQNAKQAVYAFKGDVYTGISVESLGQGGVNYLQQKVLILSGLYGILRPLDLMQPYRLEMGTKLTNPRGANLYQFWSSMLTDYINDRLASSSIPVLVNLASNEYYKSVQKAAVTGRIVTPIFKDLKNGEYKIISFYAKKARGLMVRFAADHNIQDVEELKAFDYHGYRLNELLSSENDWVFTRESEPN